MSHAELNHALSELEGKLREATGLADDYKRRGAKDLEEYYKGAKWAFEFAIASIKEILEKDAKG